ncbi:transposase domain-containing protein [Micromonospora sp. NBC_01655]|uniref:transposase domain-containing protein n=1 Tax=Micromonospora sp. NBC_01655 TaxID=2975983 RepID=UPI00338E4B9E
MSPPIAQRRFLRSTVDYDLPCGWGDSYRRGSAESFARSGGDRGFDQTFPPELVDAVIDEAQAREQRKRSLPARTDHVLHPGDAVVA